MSPDNPLLPSEVGLPQIPLFGTAYSGSVISTFLWPSFARTLFSQQHGVVPLFDLVITVVCLLHMP